MNDCYLFPWTTDEDNPLFVIHFMKKQLFTAIKRCLYINPLNLLNSS